MNSILIFSSIATIIYLIGFIPYVYHIFHGRVVPHPFSWTIWCLFSLANLSILFTTDGLSLSIIPVLIRSVALLFWAIIWWFLIKKISIGKTDYIALWLAICVIFFMRFFDTEAAIFSMIAIDLLVLSPTLRKIWNNPESEDPLAWIMSAFSVGCFLLSLEHISFLNAWFWGYLVCVNFLVAILIYRRKLYLANYKHLFLRFFSSFALKKKFW